MLVKLSYYIIKVLNYSCIEVILVKEFFSRKGFWFIFERVL